VDVQFVRADVLVQELVAEELLGAAGEEVRLVGAVEPVRVVCRRPVDLVVWGIPVGAADRRRDRVLSGTQRAGQ